MSSLPRAMDAMERFNRRTISFSSRQDVMNEVAEILQGATLEEDEESIGTGRVLMTSAKFPPFCHCNTHATSALSLDFELPPSSVDVI